MLVKTLFRCGILASALALAGIGGCTQGGGTETTKRDGNGAAGPALPAGFMLASMPENARSVAEVKGAVKAGDDVAIRGRIGGSRDPFVDGRAAFTIVDASLKACSDVPGDQCKRPWDYCCETADSLARHSATITVVDANGKPLAMSLHGVNGLKELGDVIVVGSVAQAEGNVLLVHATGIHIIAQ